MVQQELLTFDFGPCLDADDGWIKKGAWSVPEDEALRLAVQSALRFDWADIARSVPHRTKKQVLRAPRASEREGGLTETRALQCRERWRERIDPILDRSPWTREEDETISAAQELLGNRWSCMRSLLKTKRSAAAIKNRWHTLHPNRPGAARAEAPGWSDMLAIETLGDDL